MTDYEIASRVFRVGHDQVHLSVSASPSENPRLGMISRYHECSSYREAMDLLEILVDQVRIAVETSGGRIVGIVGPHGGEMLEDDGIGDGA